MANAKLKNSNRDQKFRTPPITATMPVSSSYLLPAILLNPPFVLHLINTFASHIMPPLQSISESPHPFFESLGPLPGSTPYLDMHADDRLCWGYTGIMVVLQMLAIGRVQDNRERRREARAARRKEKADKIANLGASVGLDGADDACSQPDCSTQEHPLTGLGREEDVDFEESDFEERKSGLGSDESVTETSEEEMML